MLAVLPWVRAAEAADPIVIGEIDSRTGLLLVRSRGLAEGRPHA